MSLVSSSIANLINGVSQQPQALRLASQCDLQENCNSSAVEGLRPRNGTRHRARITTTPITNAYTHLINRDETERYRVIVTSGVVRVFDLMGVEKTVNMTGSSAAYLTSSNVKEDIVALTVADYTFLLNRTKVTDDDVANIVPTRFPEALVWVKAANAGARYGFNIDGVGVSHTCGDNTDPASQNTEIVVQTLVDAMWTAMGDPMRLSYNVEAIGSTIFINRVDGAEFTVTVTDSLGDQGTSLVKGAVQRFSALPAKAKPGFKVKVKGEANAFNTDYWVEFQGVTGNPYGGVWREAGAPGQVRGLLASTMPHALVREADGTFTVKPLDWGVREVGDLDSNPMPSFVGSTINDIFFHKNRFGILADENMVMSRNGDFFNFFRESAIQLLDTDVIDVAASHTKVSTLQHAVPFNESLLLFSEQTQFILGKVSEVLSPRSVAIDQTTEFSTSKRVKPIGAGSYVYFVQERGDWSAVREFGVDADTQTKDAQEITAHVPKYVPSGVFKLAASNTDNVILALTHNDPRAIYVYQYHISDGAKLQSAWHRWVFPEDTTVLNADFVGSTLHLLLSRPDGVYLEELPVAAGYAEGDAGFSIHIDRIVDETQCTVTYNAGTDTTTIVLPYTPDDHEQCTLVAWSGNTDFKLGRKVSHTWLGSSLFVTGNLEHFRFGRKFRSRYVFSQFMIREQPKGGGQIAISQGRVTVKRLTLTHGASGYFQVLVTPTGRDQYTNVFTGKQIGSASFVLGNVALHEGSFRVPVMSRNTEVTIEVTSDEFLPYALLNADWEGQFVLRSRRM